MGLARRPASAAGAPAGPPVAWLDPPQLFAGTGFESFEPLDEPLPFSLLPLPSAGEADDDFEESLEDDSFDAESVEDESFEEESFDELSALFAAVSRWRLRVP